MEIMLVEREVFLSFFNRFRIYFFILGIGITSKSEDLENRIWDCIKGLKGYVL